jgi:CubicO group peptidase (beta-lactamase class C family)
MRIVHAAAVVIATAALVCVGCDSPTVPALVPATTRSAGDPLILAGLYAKVMCSALFVSGLREARVRAEDLAQFPALRIEVNRNERSVTASAEGSTRTAVFRDGLGCTLRTIQGHLRSLQPGSPMRYVQRSERDAAHPAALTSMPMAGMREVLREAFIETDSARIKNTRAIVVLLNGRIVGEEYSDGITADTPLPGYSMTKGIANTLVGLLVQRRWLTISDRYLVPAWSVVSADRRAEITLDHLLRMTSGLAWTETYDGSSSDLMVMLTLAPNAAAYAAAKPMRREPRPGGVDAASASLELAPGRRWRYSGGSYEIVSGIVRATVERNGEAYPPFPYEGLFRQLGMTSLTLEPDSEGTYLLSAFCLATARDWARFGQFILDEYQSRENGLLPPGWVRTSAARKGAIAGSRGLGFGAGFWVGSVAEGVPDDTFFLGGLQGQFVVVMPSRNLVVVRLGATPIDGTWVIAPVLEELERALSSGRGIRVRDAGWR